MGGGAAHLLHFHAFAYEKAVNVARARERKLHFAVQSSSVSFSGSSTVVSSRVHLQHIPRFPANQVVVGGNRRGERQCSESGVAESAPESSAVSCNPVGIPVEVVGVSYPSNGQETLSPEHVNEEYDSGKTGTVETIGEEEDELDSFSAAASLDRIDKKLQLLEQNQEKQNGAVKDESDEKFHLLEQNQEKQNGEVNEKSDEKLQLLEQSQEKQNGVKKETSDDRQETEENKSMLDQIREIFVFAGPALGIWLSGPLMSIIDTAVIGNSSSLELAALGPGTVLCDTTCFVFMFLSIATSNLIATSLANKDEEAAAGHLSRLLFVALFCGMAMLLITECFATPLLQAFVGVNNSSLIPAARLYVQIRALAWPVVLMGMVAQSASLGMQDSWAPLKVLAVASSINLFGDILLCPVLGYGIGGAAWATTVSQYVSVFLMMKSLGDKGYNPLAISMPSLPEMINMINLAAPILLTMLSKAAFYTIITFLATSLGPTTLAAHQVMIGIFSVCTVCGEPLAQTAQSFMPAFIYGSSRNLKKARVLLHNLMLIGTIIGVVLGCIALSIPWLLPQVFTSDTAIIYQMRSISAPFFMSLILTPPALSCEGTLLAGRDLQFLGFSMASCFFGGSILLLTLNRIGVGLNGSWWTLVAFQMTRFIQAYCRLSGPKSVLADKPSSSEREASLQMST